MNRLILSRHAKSSWDLTGTADHDRPLAPRGRIAAPRIGRWLAERGYTPTLVLLSTARRVAETWEGISTELGPGIPVAWDSALYHADPQTLREVLSRQTAGCVMLVAHNPGLATFSAELGVLPDRDEAQRFVTGATIVIDVEDWGTFGDPHLVDFTAPGDLSCP